MDKRERVECLVDEIRRPLGIEKRTVWFNIDGVAAADKIDILIAAERQEAVAAHLAAFAEEDPSEAEVEAATSALAERSGCGNDPQAGCFDCPCLEDARAALRAARKARMG